MPLECEGALGLDEVGPGACQSFLLSNPQLDTPITTTAGHLHTSWYPVVVIIVIIAIVIVIIKKERKRNRNHSRETDLGQSATARKQVWALVHSATARKQVWALDHCAAVRKQACSGLWATALQQKRSHCCYVQQLLNYHNYHNYLLRPGWAFFELLINH